MKKETPLLTATKGTTKKKLGWFSKIILGLNWFAIIGLLIACCAPFVSPTIFGPLAFFGLLHPVFVIINLLFLFLWTIRLRKQAFYTLAVLILSFPYYEKQLSIHFETTAAPKNAIKVMSYNVKLFDYYNWSGDKQARNKMFTLIKKELPDVLNLQEFFNQDAGVFQNLDSLKKTLGLPYAHVEYTTSARKFNHWGVVTFSKYPILNQGKIVFSNRNNNICIYTDVLINADTIRIYNMHLQSVNFDYSDYKFLDKVVKGEDAVAEIENSKNILRRMQLAYRKRAPQAEAIAQNISECPYPIMICGDFNDTPISYTYNTLSNGFTDAFIESGTGLGKTLQNPLPLPRIDYIFHSKKMKSFEFKTIETKKMSDHFPIVCKIVL